MATDETKNKNGDEKYLEEASNRLSDKREASEIPTLSTSKSGITAPAESGLTEVEAPSESATSNGGMEISNRNSNRNLEVTPSMNISDVGNSEVTPSMNISDVGNSEVTPDDINIKLGSIDELDETTTEELFNETAQSQSPQLYAKDTTGDFI